VVARTSECLKVTREQLNNRAGLLVEVKLAGTSLIDGTMAEGGRYESSNVLHDEELWARGIDESKELP
jgi:hypothetical protein